MLPLNLDGFAYTSGRCWNGKQCMGELDLEETVEAVFTNANVSIRIGRFDPVVE